MTSQRGKLVSGGRLQIPAELRRELGLSDGDSVIMRIVDGELRVLPFDSALTRARSLLRPYIPEGSRLADELISDRRKAAADE